MTETASLISEDDLPAWLRAFGEVESQKQAAPADESWMVRVDAEGAANQASAQNLAQSWQAPRARSKPAPQRCRIGLLKPGESVAKTDRVIASAAPVAPAPEPEPEVRPASGRMDLPRPTPMPRERATCPSARRPGRLHRRPGHLPDRRRRLRTPSVTRLVIQLRHRLADISGAGRATTW
ncbi:MAG: hypothetical protein U0841_33335 [Chloroflexia bacterium]